MEREEKAMADIFTPVNLIARENVIRRPPYDKIHNMRELKWFERLEYYAFRVTLLILFIAGLVKLIRLDLGW
jgi:hypothetical protein